MGLKWSNPAPEAKQPIISALPSNAAVKNPPQPSPPPSKYAVKKSTQVPPPARKARNKPPQSRPIFIQPTFTEQQKVYVQLCDTCKIVIDRKVVNNSFQCAGGHSWDGNKWSWDLCCKCYLEQKENHGANREWVIRSGCDHCIQRLNFRLTSSEKAIRKMKKAEDEAMCIELHKWKAKGFDSIPFDYFLTCRDCQDRFIFSVGEQVFYRDRNLNWPSRCKKCRDRRKGRK